MICGGFGGSRSDIIITCYKPVFFILKIIISFVIPKYLDPSSCFNIKFNLLIQFLMLSIAFLFNLCILQESIFSSTEVQAAVGNEDHVEVPASNFSLIEVQAAGEPEEFATSMTGVDFESQMRVNDIHKDNRFLFSHASANPRFQCHGM